MTTETRHDPKEAESALEQVRASPRASEDYYRLLVESVRDYAIFLLSPEGRVASWNIGAQRIKGYRASEIIGQHFSKFYPEEDIRAGKCEMELEVAAGKEGRFEDEGWRLRKDGTKFWANVVITALRSEEDNRLLGFAKVTRDLTERKRAEEERIRLAAEQKAREASDAANRAKDNFLAHVSHELRTPLNAILGWSRLLAAGLDQERAARATATVERNAVAMAQLIDDLLDISRIISGKMRLDVDIVDVALVIERAIESVKLAADAKGIKLQQELVAAAAVAPAFEVLGDATRLQQVVWNLLSNAVKFTPHDGTIKVCLRHRAEPAPSVEVVVEDTGKGIPPEMLRYVFEPFWQETRNVGGARGLGLGLAISRSIVEIHGGQIEAKSEGIGQGTKFTVSLPEAKSRDGSKELLVGRRQPSTVVRNHPPELKDVRVLVVEDEIDARDLVRAVLEEEGCIVTTASDATEAMSLLDPTSRSTNGMTPQLPELLVSDIGLPGEDGYELIRKVRALPPERGGKMPAAAITAYARGQDREKALTAGYNIHVSKPINPSELVALIATLLKSHRSRGG